MMACMIRKVQFGAMAGVLSASLSVFLRVLLLLIVAVPAHSGDKEHWVSLDASGRLVYRSLPHGDRIVDFSYAGYMGGGISLPRVSSVQTVVPSGGDDTAAIQRAIDQVSSLPLRDGFRGAVVLAPGTFVCSSTLNINASGVVLRGSGPLSGGTTLRLTGQPRAAIAVSGKEEIQVVGAIAHIADPYVPSGAHSITLDNASAVDPGDTIRITRYTTPEWLHFMGMDRMTRDGNAETWVVTRRFFLARQKPVLSD